MKRMKVPEVPGGLALGHGVESILNE